MSNPWIIHLKGVQKANPSLSYKQCMQKGKLSYNKKQRGKGLAGDAVSSLWSGIKKVGKEAASLAIQLPFMVLKSELTLFMYLKSQPDGGAQKLKEGLSWLSTHASLINKVVDKTGINNMLYED